MAVAAILVLTHMPDAASAPSLARALLDAHLAACVNVGAPVESLYHWQGEIETTREVPVAVKTLAARYPEVEAAIRARHPYELPEIIAVPLAGGFVPYLDWISAESGGG